MGTVESRTVLRHDCIVIDCVPHISEQAVVVDGRLVGVGLLLNRGAVLSGLDLQSLKPALAQRKAEEGSERRIDGARASGFLTVSAEASSLPSIAAQSASTATAASAVTPISISAPEANSSGSMSIWAMRQPSASCRPPPNIPARKRFIFRLPKRRCHPGVVTHS